MSAEQQQIPVEQVSAEEVQQATPVTGAPAPAVCPTSGACCGGKSEAVPAEQQAEAAEGGVEDESN